MLNFKKKKYLVIFLSIIIILILFTTLINAKNNQTNDESNAKNSSNYRYPLKLFNTVILNLEKLSGIAVNKEFAHNDSSSNESNAKECDPEVSHIENSSFYRDPLNLFTKSIPDLEELSGIAASNKNEDTIWAHNDSSSNCEIFALDKEGNINMKVEINEFEDIEDMCIGNYNNKEYIFLGDFGDNSEERETCTISMIEEPLLGKKNVNESKDFTFVYSDGKAHNCESIGYTQYISDGTIYLFTKEKNIRVFKLIVSNLDETEENVAEYVGKLEIEDFEDPSAVDISRDGTYLIIRDEKNIFKLSVNNPSNFDDILTKDVISIKCPEEPNGEAVTIDPNTQSLYTASEEQPKVLYEIPLH